MIRCAAVWSSIPLCFFRLKLFGRFCTNNEAEKNDFQQYFQEKKINEMQPKKNAKITKNTN